MILNTHPDNRKDMVKAISEHTMLRATYMGMPSGTYQIGTITVNMDGTITCNDEKTLENIRPLLIARGWLEAEPENEPADSGALADTYTASVSVSLPVPDWTVPQLINLLRMLCSKQYILNRMMQSNTVHIDEAFIMATTDSPPTNADDFKARIQCANDTDSIRGITFENDNFIFYAPPCVSTPELQKTYAELFTRILKCAKTATRVSIKQQVNPENEKYYANSWLMRLGFGGTQHKELRRTLMSHLNGYAAFKSTADMQAHRERQAARRFDLKAGVKNE